jgi:thiamine-monophosphate kinase
VWSDGTTVTHDTLVEGVHWNERLTPHDVGWKAVAVSVSDLAAMGASPRWMVIGLSLPRPLSITWVDAFASGLGEAARHWGVPLIGGDTTRSPGPTVIGVTMAGHATRPMQRSHAALGDRLWVTGTPGLAGAGYGWESPPPAALVALRRPQPPLAFALDLVNSDAVNGMMDISDGLAVDLPRLCRASRVGAQIHPERLPIHPALADTPNPIDSVLAGGDDYQLLFSAPPNKRQTIAELARRHHVRCTEIGEIQAHAGVRLTDGSSWPGPDFTHFGAS